MVKKNFIKNLLVMGGNFFVPGYTNVSQKVPGLIPKTEIFQKCEKWG